jgi:drug/metabolite transporter (DMT)-like permease
MKSTIKKNNGHHHRTRNNNGTLSSSPIKSLRKKKSSSNNNTSRNNSNNNDVEVKVKSKDEKIASIQERFSGIIFAILSGSCAAAAGMFGKLLFTSSPDQQQYHNLKSNDNDSDNSKLLLWKIILIVGLILSNVFMLAFFVRALKEAGSIMGTILNSAANVLVTAIIARLIFNEPSVDTKWWIGFISIMIGGICITVAEQQQRV